MSQLLDLTRERVVFYDGSMGATILNLQLDADGYGGKEGCNEYLVFHNPSIIENIHAGYLETGVDILETDTFGGSLIKLEEYGLGDQTYDLNRAAAELARRVADQYSTPSHPRFVAGSIGPTGLLPASEDPMLGQARFEEVVDLFLTWDCGRYPEITPQARLYECEWLIIAVASSADVGQAMQ